MMVIQLRGDAVVVYQTVIQLHGDGPVYQTPTRRWPVLGHQGSQYCLA